MLDSGPDLFSSIRRSSGFTSAPASVSAARPISSSRMASNSRTAPRTTGDAFCTAALSMIAEVTPCRASWTTMVGWACRIHMPLRLAL